MVSAFRLIFLKADFIAVFCLLLRHTVPNSNTRQMVNIVSSIDELHRLLKIEKKFAKPDEELISYDVAHHAGLTLEQELEMLQLFREDQRQEYLKRHLQSVIPIINEMETLKERVKLNGHFRELKSWGL